MSSHVSPPLQESYFCSQEDGFDEEKPIFFQSNVGNEPEDILLVGETVNKAILDSGASQTVCGSEWYESYLDGLKDSEREEILEYPFWVRNLLEYSKVGSQRGRRHFFLTLVIIT